MKQYEIATFEQLIEFIESNELTSAQICTLAAGVLKVYGYPKENRQTLIKSLKKWWSKYGHPNKTERPIFI